MPPHPSGSGRLAGELLEPEAVPFHLEDALLAQLGQHRGHGAALHTEVVRQLLPVKGNGKCRADVQGGLLRELGEQLFPRAAL